MKRLFLITLILILAACSNQDELPQKAEQTSQSNKDSTKVSYSDSTDFKVLSITEGIYDNTPALRINLTLPVLDNNNLAENIKVTSSDKDVKGEWIYSENKMTLFFPFIEAQTTYKIDIKPQLTSVNSKVLGESINKTVKTRNKQKKVRFLSKGNTLLKQSNKIPVEAVNVSAVDLKFWRIKKDKSTEFLRYPNRTDVYYLEKFSDMADLVHTSRFKLDSVKNKTEIHNLSIADIKPLQKPGIYFVTMTAADSYSYNVESNWFSVTDLGLHSRKYKKTLSVFAHKLSTAKTYPNVSVSLFDDKGNIIEEKNTDHEGYAEFTSDKLSKAILLIATEGENSNIIRLNQAKMDLSAFPLAGRSYKPQELFLYSPRDLYRPGETVYINGLLRDDDGHKVEASPVRVEIRRPDNRLYKSLNWQGDDNSFYSTDFRIAGDAMTGNWIFKAKLANNDIFEYEFAVEDFMPERLKLDLSSANDSLNIAVTETPKISVQSDYLYGAPASKNRYDATVTISAQNHLFENYSDYIFGSNNYSDFDLNFNTSSRQLDEKGHGEILLQPNWQDTKFPLKINSYVNVYESGGRPISRRIEQTVWPYELSIGVKNLWDGDYASPESNNSIELIAVNRQGNRVKADNVEILLIRENSQRYWQWGDDGWSYNQSEKNIPVFSSRLNISDTDTSVLNLPLDYGYYRAEIRDNQQRLISSYRFFSGWKWYDPYYANSEKPDQIKLKWLSDSLTAGQNSKLSITAPYSGTALVTVESDKLLWKKSLRLNSSDETVEIPVQSEWNRHDLHASVLLIHNGDVKRKHLPKRAFGVIHLPLNRNDRQLDIAIDAPDKILPDSEVEISINASRLNPEQETFVTLAAVDTGVLSISNFKTPDPFHWFFEARSYLAAIRDMYGSIIALTDGKDTQQKFGGDAEMTRGGDEPASEVQIISLLSDKVKFDDKGQAKVKFKMPYFNGEVRLMALAFNDDKYASADKRMKIAAPVVIETSLPRFIAKGDETYATIDVHNTENSAQTVDLQIIASDSLGGKLIQQTIQLKANEKTIMQLPIVATQYTGIGQIDIAASMKENKAFAFSRQWKIGIRPAYPAVINTTTEVLDGNQSYSPEKSLFNNLDNNNLKSVLKISKTPVLNTEEHLKSLIQYPYGCLEQTTSRAWPLLQVEKKDLALLTSEKQQEIFNKRADLIDDAISRIIGMQRYDGSFGLWSSDSSEEYWLTVYATEFLIQAKNSGYTVPDDLLQKSVKRLQYYTKGRAYLYSDLKKYLSNVNQYKLSYQAYAAYVLAGISQVNLQDIRILYDNHSGQSVSPLTLAHLAMALEKSGDAKRARDAWQKALDFKWQRDRYHYYGDYGSKVRDLSQVISLGLQSNLTQDLPKSAYQLLKPLQQAVQKNRWLSTQERGSLFRAAKAIRSSQNSTEKWQADFTVNDKQELLNQADDLLKVWKDKQASQVFNIENTGKLPIYVDFKTQGYPEKASAESNGIQVERRYFNLQGNKLDLSKVSSGDMILVHIKAKADKKYGYLPDAMLVELLPAGLELENQNLEYSMKLDEIKIDGKYIYDWMTYSYPKHTEYRDDRFIAALSLSSYNDAHIFYLARAVTPGEFTIPPTLIEDMYRPEIRALGKDDGKITIKE